MQKINVREYRRGNHNWTIQRNWLQGTQDEEKQNKNTTQYCWTPPHPKSYASLFKKPKVAYCLLIMYPFKVIPETRRAHSIRYLRIYYYHSVDTSAGELLVPYGIVCPD